MESIKTQQREMAFREWLKESLKKLKMQKMTHYEQKMQKLRSNEIEENKKEHQKY
jgi:hypothetical protein